MLSPTVAPLLAVEGLQAWYGESHVLHGADFEVLAGEVVTLLGRNGAGKTTTLKSIMGIVSPSAAGRCATTAASLSAGPATGSRGSASRFVPRSAAFFPVSTSRRTFCCRPRCAPAGSTSIASLSCFPTCKERLFEPGHQAVRAASSRCWRSARILRTGARLLLLDEPTEGLAPVIIQQIGKTIGLLKQQGFTILLVEQNFRFASTVADRYYVMEHGRIVDGFVNAELEANRRQAARLSGRVMRRGSARSSPIISDHHRPSTRRTLMKSLLASHRARGCARERHRAGAVYRRDHQDRRADRHVEPLCRSRRPARLLAAKHGGRGFQRRRQGT